MASNINRQQTAPVSFPRTRRTHQLAGLTSMPAGKVVPLAAIPMLREDSLIGHHRINVEMLETAELLMNGVNLRVMAYCVPMLAMERFEGDRGQLDRSYMGEPQVEGGSVVDFIETEAFGTIASRPFYKYLGLHAKSTDLVNTAYLEAYNAIWNFRAMNRSRDLTPRGRLTDTLAPAFWMNSPFEFMVPNFDQAVLDGEVALNVLNTTLPLSAGSAVVTYANNASNSFLLKDATTGNTVTSASNTLYGDASGFLRKTGTNEYLDLSPNGNLAATLTGVTAELAADGITVSLSNLEMARKTQAFAKLREQFDGIADEYIIDMLMAGLSIPDQMLKQPILLADVRTTFGQVKRYATDSGNLAESAVSGGATVDLHLRVPRLNTGGVVLITAEVLPDQLFERQRDPFFHSADVDAWPEALRDTLDPEKVDAVFNREIDTDHATPNSVFGYEPMNAKWNRGRVNIGGKFLRPTTNTTTDTDRQRLWSVETVNPVLGTEFFIATTVHQKVFLDKDIDNFEAVTRGVNVIEGNTQFGGLLVDATTTENNYDKVAEKAPTDRLVQS